MKITLGPANPSKAFSRLVESLSGEDLSKCYQCGNCTGGCPVSFAMDIAPSQVIRMVQLGQEEAVLRSNSIWRCVSCLQCFSRCPKCVDLSRIMESLRRLSLRRGYEPVSVKALPEEFIRRSPQMALVAGFRKLVP